MAATISQSVVLQLSLVVTEKPGKITTVMDINPSEGNVFHDQSALNLPLQLPWLQYTEHACSV